MIVPVVYAKCGCSFEVTSVDGHSERFWLKRWRQCDNHSKVRSDRGPVVKARVQEEVDATN